MPAEAGDVAVSSGVRLEERRELGTAARAWDDLVLRQPLPSPFLRSWWLESTAGHDPRFLLVFDGAELIGGLALEIDRRLVLPRILVMGSAMQPDHVDAIAAPDRRNDVGAAIRAWFEDRGSCTIDLWCLDEGSILASAVPSALVEHVEGAPWISLPARFETYLCDRPAGLPKRVRRGRSRMADEGVEHRRIPPGEVDRALEELRRLHGEVFGQESMFLPYFDRFAVAARRGAARGELVFHELRNSEETVAIDAVFELAGRVSTVQGGRRTDHRWRSVGVVLQAAVLEDACQRGMHEFDYLRGATEYKLTWAENVRPLFHMRADRGTLGRPARRLYSLATSPAMVRAVRRAREIRRPRSSRAKR